MLKQADSMIAPMSPTIFRILIVCSVVLGTGAAFLDTLFPELLPQSIAQAVENEPLPALFDNLWLTVTIFLPVLIIVIISTIGLFFLKAWARALAFYSTILSFAMYPFFGPILSSAWSSALTEASSLLWGAILAIAYYSSLRERFSAS